MSEPTEQKRAVQWEGMSTDLSSFNSYGVVTLSDGQRVNVQVTMRHGMPIEQQFEDFKKYVAFLDMVAKDHDVKFWDGSKAGTNGTEPKSTEPKTTEPTYTQVDESGAEVLTFPAGVLTVEYKNKKPYYSVTDASSKVTKFPVRIWDEALEKSGISPSDIDVVEGKELTGWTAIYEPKADSKWPAKVTLLKQPEFV